MDTGRNLKFLSEPEQVRSRNFEYKPDQEPEQEWIFQFLQEPDNSLQ